MPTPEAVLLDLDGVMYDGGQRVPGAVETAEWLSDQAIPHLYVTNTTSRDRAALVQKLASFGIDATADAIQTPAFAAAGWLREEAPGPLALFVPEGIRGEFAAFPQVADDAEAGARYVVLGDLGAGWSYEVLNRAFRLLHAEPEARLLALGMTRYWNSPDGISLDVAPFVAALEHATGKQAVVLGKPARAFFERGCLRLGCDPALTVMVGDDAKTDVGGAQAAGLRGVLVRTGKFREADLRGRVTPDLVMDSIADLPEAWARLTSPALREGS